MRTPGYAAAVGSEERFWTSRLRWRLRGAMQWPAFALLTLLDGFVLDQLPPVTTIGLNFIEGVLIATFANLFLVGALAPFIARRMARRPRPAVPDAPATPPEAELDVLRDRIATVLLGAGLLGCLASGLANRPVIVSETEATEENARAVRDFVVDTGNVELQRNIETANTVRLDEGLFRTCIARDDRRRYVCVFVNTAKDPAEVRRDTSGEPNTTITRGR